MGYHPKPLGIANYGSIPHLEGSRMTPQDHKCHDGQTRIATVKTRDRHDRIIVTEKLDGSNVGVALIEGQIIALGRAGYLANTSPYIQHRYFAEWVRQNESRFRHVLLEGERLIGEWLMQAHGTRYDLWHEPIVFFDLMKGHERIKWDELVNRLKLGNFVHPFVLHDGNSCSIEYALSLLGDYGYHGSIDKAEGCVWKVEHRGKVDFLVKYVRPDKVDGCYLPEKTGCEAIWNYPEFHNIVVPAAIPEQNKEG